MPVDNQASRFAAATAGYHRHDPDMINLPLLRDTWEFVFRTLENPHLDLLVAMTPEQISRWVEHFMDDMLEVGSELAEAVDARIQEFYDMLIPCAELMAEASDKNLDNPASWRWMFARLPLTPGLASGFGAMSDQEREDFISNGDFSGEDPAGGMWVLNERYPDLELGNVNLRLDHLYTALEHEWFGQPSKEV